MFRKLLESGNRVSPLRLGSGGIVALLSHLVLGGAAAWWTLQAELVARAAVVPVVVAWPEESPHRHSLRPPPSIARIAVPTFPTLTASPIQVPLLPPGTRFDPTPWLRGDDSAAGAEPGTEGGPWNALLVEEQPALLAAPVPAYPEPLRRAGIAGRVVLEAVIDTLGRAEAASVAVVQSTHGGFDAPARDCIRRALFRPARVHGRAVRVLIRVPIDFRLDG